MVMKSSGQISLSEVNIELGFASTTLITFNDSKVRTLFGKSSGNIGLFDGYGKADRVSVNLIITANVLNYNIFSNKGTTYVAGKTDVVLTINNGIKIGSSATTTYALDTGIGWVSGDTITIVNNGYIVGCGGSGGAGAGGSNGSG